VTMSPLMPAVGVAAVAAALLVLALVVLPAGPSRVPRSRLDPTATVVPSTSALAGAGAAAGAAVEKVLVKRGRLAEGAAALDRAGMTMRLPDFVLTVGIVTVVLGAVGALLGGILLGLVLAAAVPFGAKLLLRFRASRRQAAFADQLDDSLQLMAGSLRAGHSLLRAVDSVASEADAPTSEEFARIVNETRVGRDLSDALDEVAERMGSEDFTWVAQAIAIHREVGGNLAEVLDAVGHTIRERNAIRRQVKALSAEGKLSAIVLMALPFGVTFFISMTNPAYIAKFTESLAGYAMLGTAALMLLVGGLWLKSTVKIKF
jgi:tight adherence protein B